MLNKSVSLRSAAAFIVKKLAVYTALMLMTGCSLLQPAPEIIDQGPKEQPLPPLLVEGYNAGLELLQDMDEAFSQAAEEGEPSGSQAANEAAETARQHWLALSEQYPEYPGVWTNLALSQYRLQQYENSHSSLLKTLDINAGFCPAFKLKGMVERELGKFTDAENSYLAAMQCDPKDADVAYNLGILYDLYMQELDKALAQYQRAQQLLGEPDATLTVWIPDLQRRTDAQKTAEASARSQVAGE